MHSTSEKDCVSSISKSSPVKCCCGKTCNGVRGLKLHHRSCRVVQSLGDISVEDVHVDSNDSNGVDNPVPTNVTNIMPVIKPGIKLPKTDSQWKTANDYFHAMLPMSMIDPKNIGDSILKMNEVLYNYCKNTYGIVGTIYQATWKDKYEPMQKKDLKSCLRTLKRNQAPYSESKYVSRLPRSRINHKPVSNVDDQIKRNFWQYVKQNFNHKIALSPTFNASICTEFFGKFFATISGIASPENLVVLKFGNEAAKRD